MDQGSWQPILKRSAREAALEAARAIATALAAPSRAASTPSASLAGGDAAGIRVRSRGAPAIGPSAPIRAVRDIGPSGGGR